MTQLSKVGGPVACTAEDVLMGHPDRLADAIAEGMVDGAVASDPDALVGVEVGVHRKVVFVTGRLAVGKPEYQRAIFPNTRKLVQSVYQDAGYDGRWLIDPRVETDLAHDFLSDEERAIRGVSDDQNVVVGYACGSEATGYLPPAVFVARRFRDALGELRREHAKTLGPDGKVLVRFDRDGGRFAWRLCNVSIQHRKRVGYEELHRIVVPAFEATARALEPLLPGLGATWSANLLRVNGAGEFSCGGPAGDNGLSGKKLVVDHYGPGVPIGGGALCGKDPHKVDRAGALRARQIAVRLLRATGAAETTVWLGYLPGGQEATGLAARIDTENWDDARIEAVIPLPDLSIEGTVRDLELTGVKWRPLLARGYFGSGERWDLG